MATNTCCTEESLYDIAAIEDKMIKMQEKLTAAEERTTKLEGEIKQIERDWINEREDKLVLYNAIERAVGEINIAWLRYDNYAATTVYEKLIGILQVAMHKIDPRWISK